MHLVATDLAFAYPGRPVLAGVDLRVSAGVRLGVVGENGSGKSTLLHLLAGDLVPSSGEVRRTGSVGMVEQELTAPPGVTVGDLVDATLADLRRLAADLEAAAAAFDHESGDLAALGALLSRAEHLAAWDADRRVDEALTRLGAVRDRDRALETLSVGQRYRVRLACRLAERADLLLLDEPTNHLDDSGLDYLTETVVGWHGGVVLVTHDRELIDDVVTAVFDLDPSMDGVPVLYGQPGYLSYRFAKNQALQRWKQRYRTEQQRADELAFRLDRSYEGLSDEWRPPKGSQKHRRGTRARIHVKAADRLVEKLKAEAVDVPPPPLELAFPDLPALSPGWDPAEPLVDLRSPRVESPDGGVRLDLPGTRLAVPPSGRLLVVGPNGTGKSTLLGAFAGTLPLARGTRTSSEGVRIGVVGQEGRVPDGGADARRSSESGFDAYAAEALALLDRGELDPEHLVPVAALGLLTEEELDRPLRELSVGQRRRFDIALALLHAPHLLVLDEPTNHLSVDLVDALTIAFERTSAAVVVATHDRRMRADLAAWPVLDLG
ncbi:ATP-binding cassette domain-containing protein [Isoptericola sp. S6320L]|uniref:ATP-binding cassette domain-containing protein n=1 Tax=Isoptericola sp. S6320L TaxID=2926411 RepID=UPI001FF5E618|nr:ATP-binding cassette domain-containing protein [Isoptericola sp. S6320L]MCK0117322.1 ATP-binding cassette domain-containing protein [Isoptericola sp. S6320L]